MNISVSKTHPWYFDSGCSRHMTTNKSFFTTFTNFDGGNVTFGDGNMGRVKMKALYVPWVFLILKRSYVWKV